MASESTGSRFVDLIRKIDFLNIFSKKQPGLVPSPGASTPASYVLQANATWGPPGSVTGGPPTGAAGGDLSGTYPTPSVVSDSHSHTAATLSGVVKPGDAAGGVLTGTYPDPSGITSDVIAEKTADAGVTVDGVLLKDGLIVQGAWTALAPLLENDWVPYGGGYGDPEYLLDSMGFVHLRGAVAGGTTATSRIAVLPSGVLPGAKEGFLVPNDPADPTAAVFVSVDTNGRIKPEAAGSNAFISLAGITFFAQG